jgi:hypothetical protein
MTLMIPSLFITEKKILSAVIIIEAHRALLPFFDIQSVRSTIKIKAASA